MDLKKYSHKFIDMLDESEVQGTIEYSNYDKKQCVANIEKILSGGLKS